MPLGFYIFYFVFMANFIFFILFYIMSRVDSTTRVNLSEDLGDVGSVVPKTTDATRGADRTRIRISERSFKEIYTLCPTRQYTIEMTNQPCSQLE